ncbi:MAG: Cytochrome c family protein [Bacteroidetes bacterium]|nr:MAG: Cytochrome c family protein [Bacteroidota bacterium]
MRKLSMIVRLPKAVTMTFILLTWINFLFSQISPGDLAEAHAHLEGLSNCTLCHTLGSKVSDSKCLDCHKELKSRIDLNKGYHVSKEVKNKSCVSCHNDHHGRKFEIIRFDTTNYDHQLSGYELEGSHNNIACKACHQQKFISDKQLKQKKYTFLGLQTECLSCHTDYHQKTLSNNCLDCHGFDKFSPAEKFNHAKTDYPLVGKHTDVECLKCHKKEIKNGLDFQQFNGIQFANCNSCHTDVHENKFGNDCKKCHTETSFRTIKTISNFDHSKTDYPLEGKHLTVVCSACHKKAYTEKLKFINCIDCHTDYHKGQLSKPGIPLNCASCHTVNGFQGSSYSVEQHQASVFPLKGAHVATPCFECHKKTDVWSFREIGKDCNDCHKDIHQSYIDEKYYPQANCLSCHDEQSWGKVVFDHELTGFRLEGKHQQPSCRACHFKEEKDGTVTQRFSGLTEKCTVCHTDNHQQQFDVEGVTDCRKCHDFENWKATNFNHNTTKFPLVGKHAEIACTDCHKETIQNNTRFIPYKLSDYRCEACH